MWVSLCHLDVRLLGSKISNSTFTNPLSHVFVVNVSQANSIFPSYTWWCIYLERWWIMAWWILGSNLWLPLQPAAATGCKHLGLAMWPKIVGVTDPLHYSTWLPGFHASVIHENLSNHCLAESKNHQQIAHEETPWSETRAAGSFKQTTEVCTDLRLLQPEKGGQGI